MRHAARGLAIGATLLALSAPALAQTDQSPPAPVETRPATASVLGDTGIWFVPSGEVLPGGKWSGSAYRVNFDREEGFSDISHFVGTFAYGVGGRAEIFGSVRVDTRIKRRMQPFFVPGTGGAEGLLNDHPGLTTRWSGNAFGDSFVGAKVNLLSEHTLAPVAFAVRGILQLPTGSFDSGAGTGKLGGAVDAIISKEFAERVEMAWSGGVVFRGSPDDIALSHTARLGWGMTFPSRAPLRAFVEATYEAKFNKTIDLSAPFIAADGSQAPDSSFIREPFDIVVGATYQARNGFFAGGGVLLAVNQRTRQKFGDYSEPGGDLLGIQVRLGYHPGVPVYVPPPPPPPPPPPNQPPMVSAQCSPCTVNVGEQATVSADGQDPDGDTLTFRWSAPAGTLADASATETRWTAPQQEGPVPVTVTVNDGKGGTASDSVTIQVVLPPKREIVFEDVHFDFDRYTLRPEAARLLDEVVETMRDDPEVQISIEGHTCNIGTAEYNLALGERRANGVRDYLTDRGIPANRLRTVSYGEERPKHDNAREETRRLNRRAALVVRLQ